MVHVFKGLQDLQTDTDSIFALGFRRLICSTFKRIDLVTTSRTNSRPKFTSQPTSDKHKRTSVCKEDANSMAENFPPSSLKQY